MDFDTLVRRALDSSTEISCSTRLQYESELRRFKAAIKDRDPLTVRPDEVKVYIANLPSRWTQRRAKSALAFFYGFTGTRRTEEMIERSTFARPKISAIAELRKTLEEAGWSTRRLASLTWQDVRDELLLASGQVDKQTRVGLKAIFVRRFPQTKRLFGGDMDRRVFAESPRKRHQQPDSS